MLLSPIIKYDYLQQPAEKFYAQHRRRTFWCF